MLREFFPAGIEAFNLKNVGLASAEARSILATASTQTVAAKLTKPQLRRLLVKAGRRRNIDTWVDRLHHVFRTPQMRHPQQVEAAFGRQCQALIRQLDAAYTAADQLAHAAIDAFDQHDNAEIITSFPGLGQLTGSRLLAELGDDPTRFTNARALKAYAGAAPITRASGKTRAVHHRNVKIRRLAAVGYVWAFAALASPGVRAHYDRRRQHGENHTPALRNTFNRLLGCLYNCIQTGQTYNEHAAFGHLNQAT